MAKKKAEKIEKVELEALQVAKVTAPEAPITMTFRSVVDTANGNVLFLDTYLMLNDVELGTMAPGMYFFAAENSKRAEELNFIAIDMVAHAMDVAKVEWDLEPVFSLLTTTRFLEDEDKFASLLAKLESMELPKSRLIITFSALTVLHLGRDINRYLRILREAGYKIALTDYTVDTADLSLFFDYSFDYLRVDADYLEDSYKYTRKKSAVEVMVAFAEKEEITLVANGVASAHLKSVMTELGLTIQSGKAVSRGSYKLDVVYGIQKEEDTVGLDLQAEYSSQAIEVVEEEAPKARKNNKKKNKTAVLENEVSQLEKADETEDSEKQAKPAKKGKKKALAEAAAPIVEKAEEVVEEIVEEQPAEVEAPIVETAEEVVEETVEEQPAEVEEPIAETAEEVAEETVEEQPAEVEEPIAETAEEVVETENLQETVTPEQIPAEDESQTDMDSIIEQDGYDPDNVALSQFVQTLDIQGLTYEDYLSIKKGGLDALPEDTRQLVLDTLEKLS